MISDTLFEWVTDLDHYLNSPTFDGTYEGELREWIIRLRNEAEYIRLTLDVPPDCPLPPESVYWSGSISSGVERRNIAVMCWPPK